MDNPYLTDPGKLDELEALEKAATPTSQCTIYRYDHGGGRVIIEGPGLDRELVVDFYAEHDREFFLALRNAAPNLIAALRTLHDIHETLKDEITASDDSFKNDLAVQVESLIAQRDACCQRVDTLRQEIERLRTALESAEIGMCAVAVPHPGEREVLQMAVDMVRDALAPQPAQEPPAVETCACGNQLSPITVFCSQCGEPTPKAHAAAIRAQEGQR